MTDRQNALPMWAIICGYVAATLTAGVVFGIWDGSLKPANPIALAVFTVGVYFLTEEALATFAERRRRKEHDPE